MIITVTIIIFIIIIIIIIIIITVICYHLTIGWISVGHYFFNYLSLLEQGTHEYVGCGRFPVLHVRQIF